uniref:peptide-methionine (S)-S-oxide reductase n=1 Tax=Heterorhabditis bacteriophora TaxID=37862 RepID=A0A1I7W7A5_HETBA
MHQTESCVNPQSTQSNESNVSKYETATITRGWLFLVLTLVCNAFGGNQPSPSRKPVYYFICLDILSKFQNKFGYVETNIAKLEKFYQAEDYHQKYWLRNNKNIFNQLKLDDSQVANSVLATKLNAYAAGYTDFSELSDLQNEYQLSQPLVEQIIEYAKFGGDSRACH